MAGFTVTVKDRLAEGGFGVVDLVTDVVTHAEYVTKRCIIQTKETEEAVKKEVQILQLFPECDYFVRCLGAEYRHGKIHREALIMMEYYPGGHLLDRLTLRGGQHIPQKAAYKLFGQLLVAINCLHFHDPVIIHRDLKLENVLIDATGSPRLCDFGSCVFGTVKMDSSAARAEANVKILKETTPIYRAPELVDIHMRDELTEKTDIW